MARIPRNDYGADAVVAENQETLKRWNNVNTPFSVESTGLEFRKDLYIESADISFDTVPINTRVLAGNQEGVVTAVTSTGVAPDEVLTGITMSFDDHDGEPREITMTVEEIKASGNYFFVKR